MPEPDRVGVDGPLVRQAGLSQVTEVQDRERGVPAAAITPPFDIPPRDPVDHHLLSVRRIGAAVPPRSGEQSRTVLP